MEIFETILEWLQAILALLSGGFVFVFNKIALLVGLLPFGITILIFGQLSRISIFAKKWLSIGSIFAGSIVISADLYYRHYYNDYTNLDDYLNWISPYRGGQFMFIPVWFLGFILFVFAIISLFKGAPEFVRELFPEDQSKDLDSDKDKKSK